MVFDEDLNGIELAATFVILIVAVSVICYKLRQKNQEKDKEAQQKEVADADEGKPIKIQISEN